ncbi:energy transducer TonB [Labrenzia sp. PHM005]|uniref:energy transducer TonB n=1 Tax=Labrenzia sp. PHM005 TaxID=2590016 RepID=UPI0011408E91|nr:energy transducer TonB [Labrenzia sp. PHM005]QDG77391.1 TonB family protein [Labrenzia sp. PHM005]
MSGLRKAFLAALCLSLAIHVGAVALTIKSKPDLEIAGAGEVQSIVLGSSPFSTISAGAVPQAETVPPAENPVAEQPVVRPQTDAAEIAPTQLVSPVQPPLAVPTVAVAEVQQMEAIPLAQTGGELLVTPKQENKAVVKSPPLAPAHSEVMPAPEAVAARQVEVLERKQAEPAKEVLADAARQPQKFPEHGLQTRVNEQVDPLKEVQTSVPAPKLKPAPPKREIVKKLQKTKNKKTATRLKKNQKDVPKAQTARRAGAGGKSNRTAQKGGSERKGKGKTAGNSDVTSYPARVHRKVLRSVRSPRSIGRLKTDAHVRFTVQASGAVAGVRLVRSSGNEAFDQVALKSVRRAAPFPAIPASAKRKSWTFTLPIGAR